jgi:hypothetical protein
VGAVIFAAVPIFTVAGDEIQNVIYPEGSDPFDTSLGA